MILMPVEQVNHSILEILVMSARIANSILAILVNDPLIIFNMKK